MSPESADDFVNQPIRSRVLNYDAAPFVPVPGSAADSPSATGDPPAQRVGFNSPANRYYELSAHSKDNEDDEESSSATPTRQTEEKVERPLPLLQVKAVDLTKESGESEDDRMMVLRRASTFTSLLVY